MLQKLNAIRVTDFCRIKYRHWVYQFLSSIRLQPKTTHDVATAHSLFLICLLKLNQ